MCRPLWPVLAVSRAIAMRTASHRGAQLARLRQVIQPIELGPNQPRQFYLGGEAIAELRGISEGDGYRPEDWVGSATPRFGMEEDGLSRLPGGRYLRDALQADPENWLGPEHVEYFGASPALLVK